MELPDLNQMEDIILTIEEEDGTQTECEMICMFEYDERAYAALTPTDENNNEAYLFHVTFEDQGDEIEFTIDNIEDEDLLEEVGQVFESIMAEQNGDDGDGFVIEEEEGTPIDSHMSIEKDDEDDAFWDQFINKKLEEI